MKITTISPPKKGKLDHYFLAGDWHTEKLDIPTFNILLSHAKLLPKSHRNLVIMGDFLDAPHLRLTDAEAKKIAKNTHLLEEEVIPKNDQEFDWGNDILDKCQKVFNKIYLIGGNHCELRYRRFMEMFAPHAYKHNFDMPKRLKLKERGIRLIKYNHWLDIGQHVALTHGMYHGSSHNKRHFETCGKNVFYGHMHQVFVSSFIKRGKTQRATSLPCMCNLNPDYTRDAENNWSNGYGHLIMRDSSIFNFYTIDVWDDMAVLNDGTVLNG